LWESFLFKGSFKQTVFKTYRQINGSMVPVANPETGYIEGVLEKNYEAFQREDLIKSLVRLVNKVKQNGKQQTECKKWIKKNGFLTVPEYSLPSKGELLEEFWKQSSKLVSLWKMYEQATNRDITTLKKLVEISIEPLSTDEIENEEFLWGEGNDARAVVKSSILPEISDAAFGIKLQEIQDNVFAPYQTAIMLHVAHEVNARIGRPRLEYKNLTMCSKSDVDAFKIEVEIKPSSLLQAMYLQFLQTLTEKRLICPICEKAFKPKRKDQVYCNSSCRQTAWKKVNAS
jgi:hypothetical protein